MSDAQTRRPASTPTAIPLDAPSVYPFPRDHQGLMPWPRVVEQLAQAQNYWLATTRPDGRPHVTPIWGAWLDDAFYFQGAPTSRWARNLAANTAAAINLESGSEVVIVEGVVEHIVTDRELASRLIAAWETKYGPPEHPPQPDTTGLLRLQPRVVRAWGPSMQDGARWVMHGAGDGSRVAGDG